MQTRLTEIALGFGWTVTAQASAFGLPTTPVPC
jgi:hypothetical protein